MSQADIRTVHMSYYISTERIMFMKLKKLCAIAGFILLFVVITLPRNVGADEKVKVLYVNGVDVLSSKNMSDVLGDGTVSFDREKGMLTLKGATLTKGYTKESFAENPCIFFEGDLTLFLVGDNKITCGTSTVMSQALRDNAVYGSGKLTVTAEDKATLAVGGMVSMPEYVQKSGTVTVSLTNDHTKITKWALYINKAMSIEGGTLEISTVGKNKDGAICLDAKALTIAAGARLYEGDKAPGTSVSALIISSGLTFNTKNYIKIVLPDIKQESTVPTDTAAKPVIKLKQDSDKKSITVTIKKTENASGYYIYRKGPGDTGYKKVKTLKQDGSEARSITFSDLEPGTYSFKVKAYLKTDNKIVKGKYSKVKKIELEKP